MLRLRSQLHMQGPTANAAIRAVYAGTGRKVDAHANLELSFERDPGAALRDGCNEIGAMAYKAEVKTTFEPSRVIQPIYTGGSVALSRDGSVLATCLGDEALLTDLHTGAHLARIEGVSAMYGVSLRGLTLTKLLGWRGDHDSCPRT